MTTTPYIIDKHKSLWRATVTINGKKVSMRFWTKQDAITWAVKQAVRMF